jgi:copper chaperone CopZ
MSYAQYTKAKLTASGLTCSMCNLATQKQLQSLNFVDSIVPDLALNAFHIYFNQQHEVDFGQIRKKVEDAGFFVAELNVYYQPKTEFVYKSPLLKFNNTILFIKGYDPTKSEHIFKFIDEGFLTTKALKKYKKIRNEMVLSSNSPDVILLTQNKVYYVVEE